MVNKFKEKLHKILKNEPDFLSQEGDILTNTVIDKAYKADSKLIELLIGDKEIKDKFFKKIKDVYVFNINDFVSYVQDKNFLNDSYTKFKNKIGLNIDGKFLNERKEVSLVWPFKDCVLDGGMTKEDEKRKEIFFNEILAQDDIDKLLAPKVLTNWKRYTKNGEEKVKDLKRDKDGTIQENLIIKGNNLLALHSLKEEFAGKVKLIYIDPPYNTGSDSFGYNDNFNHSSWLTFMKNRLEVARELLSEDGSIYVQMDFNEVHYLKILLDEIFGRQNLQREIIWSKGNMFGYAASAENFVLSHDSILFYTKSKKKVFNKTYESYSDEYIKQRFIHDAKDGKGLYRLQGKNQKQYISDSKGVPMSDVWDIPVVNVMAKEKVFDTQKPEALIKRVIEASSNEGDIVLDFMSGGGTTGVVAHKLKRQFILCEQMDNQVEIVKKRLEKTINAEIAGISKLVNWKGGGNFIYCELMKYNEQFVKDIEKAKDIKILLKIWKEMKEKAFFNYNFKMQEFEKDIEEFKKYDLKKQKNILLEILNKNQLYVNLSDIEDAEFKVGIEDKELNKEFYG